MRAGAKAKPKPKPIDEFDPEELLVPTNCECCGVGREESTASPVASLDIFGLVVDGDNPCTRLVSFFSWAPVDDPPLVAGCRAGRPVKRDTRGLCKWMYMIDTTHQMVVDMTTMAFNHGRCMQTVQADWI